MALVYEDYLTVQEAARILGVTARSVYGYIAKGQLPATRVGERIVVKENEVFAFDLQAPGRPRVLIPAWHIPPTRNRQYVTMVTVRVRPGQDEALESKLVEIHGSAKHCFFGTSARYVVRNQCDPSVIDLVLVWRGSCMPEPACREASLIALATDLTEVLDWETAVVKEGQSLLHAG
jgi:excisionase family DNA binding protein